jgi:hypothetical protein
LHDVMNMQMREALRDVIRDSRCYF